MYVNYIQKCAKLCLLLTTKFYLFLLIYKLTICDHMESWRHLL